MRTYGLSGSGMDVDQMVKDLMKARRASYDKLWQKKTQLEWKKADYNTMYTTLRDFRNTTAFNYKMQSTLLPKKISSSAESTVSVTANADAANVSHTIKVEQLAEGVTKTSSAAISVPAASKNALTTQLGIDVAEPAIKVTLKNGTLSKEITIDPTKSIYDFVSSINNAGINVKANYDTALDRFFLYTTNSGSQSGIEITDHQLTQGANAGKFVLKDMFKLDTAAVQGKDAKFELDGVSLTQSSNTFTVSGVTYTLKGTHNMADPNSKTIVSITPDNDKAIANVKSFVDAYNSTLDKINAELKETKYKEYLPLTQEMKNGMKDTEVTEWEKLAKSGMLRRDPILQDAVFKLRSDISTPISGITGKYNSLSAIGVTTGDYSEGGKLYLDEAKLKKALEEDPDVLNKIFGTSGDTSNAQGVAVRMYNTLKMSMDKVFSEAGLTASTDGDTKSVLAKRINDYEDQLDNMNRRLQDIESRYYKQFDAMEAALNRMNQQSSWLSQQLGGQ